MTDDPKNEQQDQQQQEQPLTPPADTDNTKFDIDDLTWATESDKNKIRR